MIPLLQIVVSNIIVVATLIAVLAQQVGRSNHREPKQDTAASLRFNIFPWRYPVRG